MTTTQTAKDRERYQVLKSMLEERRNDIKEKLRSLRETLPVQAATVTDAEEQSVNDFVQDVELALMEMKSETLTKIDEAIQRLEDGRYGTCSECDTEISEARLKALPFATLCIHCQEQEESRAADRPDTRAVSNFAPLATAGREGEA